MLISNETLETANHGSVPFPCMRPSMPSISPAKLPWLIKTPFGTPAVPEVNIR